MAAEPTTAHRRPAFGRGLAWRIALVGIVSALVAVGIITAGVLIVGSEAMAHLMMEHGETAEASYAMFDQSIRDVLWVATIVAIVAGVALAIALSRMLARPLADIGAAARRVADGDLSIRVPRAAPDELASLADSFNQMAAELEESERQRRDIIANTAHELRTPLTNLEGYLEAIRDGVIVPDQSTYESLLEETERLVRLARSLDDLALGDAAHKTAHPTEVDLATLLIGGGRADAAHLRGPAPVRWNDAGASRCRRARIPTSSRRCSSTCSRTPRAMRPRAASSHSAQKAAATPSS